MPYRYRDDLTMADVAFQAEGFSLEELFASAWEATLRVMIEEPGAIANQTSRNISLEESSLDLLLYGFLQELIYFKDAEQLFLKIEDCRIEENATESEAVKLAATATGEAIAAQRHRLGTDVKAVTFHNFSLTREEGLWRATVVLDV